MNVFSSYKCVLLAAIGTFLMISSPCYCLDKKQKSRIEKMCKKECKQLKKEGWTVYGKAQELDDAVLKYYLALEENPDGMQSIVATAEATDINQAKSKAQLSAKNQLASMRESNVESETMVQTTNEQGTEGVKSNTKMVSSSKSSVNQQVKSFKPELTLLRKKADGKFEVQVYYLVKSEE